MASVWVAGAGVILMMVVGLICSCSLAPAGVLGWKRSNVPMILILSPRAAVLAAVIRFHAVQLRSKSQNRPMPLYWPPFSS